MYQTIEFAHLAKLAPFTDNFRLERIIVDAAKSLDLPVPLSAQFCVATFTDSYSVYHVLKSVR